MTKEQAIDLGVLAMELLPRTTAGQAKLFVETIELLPHDIAERALREHARSNVADPNRLCISGFRSAMENISRGLLFRGKEKWQRDRAEAIEREAKEKREKACTDASVTAARDFCQRNADRLDEWRAEIIRSQPHLGRLCEGRPTMQSTAMICAIYTKFGKVPVECGL